MMERTKFSTKNSFKYASSLARNSPFVINPEKATSTFRRNRYGKLSVAVLELMPERAERTLLAMVKMAGGEPGRIVECSLKEIARERGATTNFGEDVMGPLREDIRLLLKTGVRINMDGELKGKKGLIFNDTLIHGGINKDDSVRFDISQHLVKVIKDSKQGYFYVQYQIYSKLRSPIARRSYLFLVGQSKIRAGKEYKIDLEKYCGHIGYYVGEDMNWSVVRDILRPGLAQLDDIVFEAPEGWKHGYKFEGRGAGFLIAHGKKAVKSPTRKKTTTRYSEVIDKIKDALLENYDTKHLWKEGELIKQLGILEGSLKDTLKKHSFSDFIRDYCRWLIGEMPIDYFPKTVNLDKLYYSTKLFDENNPMFKQFMDGWESKAKALASADAWMNRDDEDDDEETDEDKERKFLERMHR